MTSLKSLSIGPGRMHFPRLRALSLYPQRSVSNVRQALELPLEEQNLLNVPTDEEFFRLVGPAGLRRTQSRWSFDGVLMKPVAT